MGEDSFGTWGWRIPFLLSGILLVVSIWIRLSLNKSPIFQKMKDEGKTSKRPLTEAFGEWAKHQDRHPCAVRRHRRRSGGLVRRTVLRAVFPDPDPQGARRDRADPDRRCAGTRHTGLHPVRLAFGQIGRKPIILAGFLLAALTYFPIFKGITHFANPKLGAALASRR